MVNGESLKAIQNQACRIDQDINPSFQRRTCSIRSLNSIMWLLRWLIGFRSRDIKFQWLKAFAMLCRWVAGDNGQKPRSLKAHIWEGHVSGPETRGFNRWKLVPEATWRQTQRWHRDRLGCFQGFLKGLSQLIYQVWKPVVPCCSSFPGNWLSGLNLSISSGLMPVPFPMVSKLHPTSTMTPSWYDIVTICFVIQPVFMDIPKDFGETIQKWLLFTPCRTAWRTAFSAAMHRQLTFLWLVEELRPPTQTGINTAQVSREMRGYSAIKSPQLIFSFLA